MEHDSLSIKELATRAMGHPDSATRDLYCQEFRKKVQSIRQELIQNALSSGCSMQEAMRKASTALGASPNESRDLALLGKLDKLTQQIAIA